MAATSDRMDREAVAVLDANEALGALVAVGRAASQRLLRPLTNHTAVHHFQAAGIPWQPNTTSLRGDGL